MKFTDTTLSIIKNFSTINQSIMLRKGNLIKTVSPLKDVMAVADIEEEIEGDAGIYNIPQFLSSLSLFNEPDVKFDKDRFVISDERRSMHYTYAAENLILSPAKDRMVVDGIHTEFDISWEELKNIINASAVLQLPDIKIMCSEDSVNISTINKTDPTSNFYAVDIKANFGTDCVIHIPTTKLKMYQGGYRVSISDNVVEWKGETVTYWIAVAAEQKR